jgi:hypothetical protein
MLGVNFRGAPLNLKVAHLMSCDVSYVGACFRGDKLTKPEIIWKHGGLLQPSDSK